MLIGTIFLAEAILRTSATRVPPSVKSGTSVTYGEDSPLAHDRTQHAFQHASHPKRLTVDRDGQFKISVFQDLHFGEAEDLWWGTAQDIATTEVMDVVLRSEKPDLVVLNGDLITGENTYCHNSSQWLPRLVEPMVARGTYWASTYGNHDNQYNLSSQAIKHEEETFELSLTGQMVPGIDVGITNYYLEIFARNSADVPLLRLWFFDSRGGVEYQQTTEEGETIGIGSYVHPEVAEWYSATDRKLEQAYQHAVASLAFVHIPPHASRVLQGLGINNRTAPGINDDNSLAAQGQSCDKSGACHWSGADLAFTKALVDTKGLVAIFSGHDHGLDWCAKWNATVPDLEIDGRGINLCFGRHTGYGGYGAWTRGSRQIVVHTRGGEVSGIETWNRLESQRDRPANATELAGHIWLNETYGSDLYPAVKSTFTRLEQPGEEHS